MAETVHVLPVNDLIGHDWSEAGGGSCVCGPSIEYVDSPMGDAWLIVHASLDGRELTEPDDAS